MSIMPQQKLLALQKLNSQPKKQTFLSNRKLFKLASISNQLQSQNKNRTSMCDRNLIVPDAINEQINGKSPQSINPFLFTNKKNKLFSNQKETTNQKSRFSNLNNESQCGIKRQQIGHNKDYPQNNKDSQKNIPRQATSSNSLKSSLKVAHTHALIDKVPLQPGVLNVLINQIQDKQEAIVQKKLSFSEYRTLIRQRIRTILQSIPFQIFITLLTIGSLFMQDFRMIFVDREHDSLIDYVNLVFLGTFLIQIMMSLTVQNYAFSFFFYLDVISTLSICMDVTIFTNIIYDSGGNTQQLNLLITQSKASRAAARAVRIMKIFRLARVVKLYKSAIKTKQLNQLKQKQRLKQQLRAKKNFDRNNQAFMNQNFQGQTSEYKLSFTNNLSIRDRQHGFSQKSQKGSGRVLRQASNSLKSDLKIGKRQNMQMIDRIHEEPINEEFSQKVSSKYISSSDERDQFDQLMNPSQLSQKQSNISKILSDSTIKKIIIVILIIMFSMTAMDTNNYYPQNTSWDFLTSYVGKLLLQPNVSISYINKMIQKKIQYFKTLDINSQVIAFQTPFNEVYGLQTIDYNQLRITQVGVSQAGINISQILRVRPQLTLQNSASSLGGYSSLDDTITIVLSYKSYNIIDSWFSIAKIIFICLTIIYLLQSFNTNISNLIVTPIEKMLQIIINPDKKVQEEQEQSTDFKQARYQTLIVQKAIVKIRGLMSTIFGRIGMDLVYSQLFNSQNINAASYLSAKKKSFSIYGICRIQNFVQISQTLQSDTFTFVNQIAQIVHSAVYRYGGYGVKNLPDGFLVVFKLPQGKQKQIIQQAMKTRVSKQKKNTYLNVLCDFSVFSLVKMIIRLHKQPKLLQYKKDQRILHKFGNNFQIQMNFSVGIGQSIEGMVGSQFKIDPVYLGGKLDQIWKFSQVAQKHPNLIIMQKQLYQNLTVGLKTHCRIMDYIRLNQYDQGNTQIYGVDLDLQYISPSRGKAEKYKITEDQPDIELKKQLNMQNLKDSTQINNYYAQGFINSKKQLREVMKKKISDEMRKKYQIGFNAYISGDWVQAKQTFEEIIRVIKQDVLSKRIYNYISQRGFKYTQNIKQYKSVKEL